MTALADLRALAEQAEGQAWTQNGAYVETPSGDLIAVTSERNAPFIAACDPQTVLALVEVAEAAQAFLEASSFSGGEPLDRLDRALAGLGITAEPCPSCGCPGEQYDGHACEDFGETRADADPAGITAEEPT